MNYCKEDIKAIVESQLRITVDVGSIAPESFCAYFVSGDFLPSNPAIPADARGGANYKVSFPKNKVYFGTLIISTADTNNNSTFNLFLDNAQVAEYTSVRNITALTAPILFQNFNLSDNVIVQFVGYAVSLP